MLTLLTFNINGTSDYQLADLGELMSSSKADIIALQEVTWARRTESIKEIMSVLGFQHYAVSLSRNTQNHILLLSRYPFSTSVPVENLINAGLVSTIASPYGLISVANVHLAPSLEYRRLDEVDSVIRLIDKVNPSILLGDFNAITAGEPVICSGTPTEPVEHSVTNFILGAGFIDTGRIGESSIMPTVQSTKDGDVTYYNLRLDYIYIKGFHKQKNLTYRTLRSDLSDHVPIALTLY